MFSSLPVHAYPPQREQGLPSHVITVSGRTRQDVDNGVAVAKKVRAN